MTETAAAPTGAAVAPVRMFGRDVSYKAIVASVFVSALFLDILDLTIVNVALPTMGREFRTDQVEWVVLGYTLSLAVWIPASGWLGDRFGTKRTFLTALVLFVAGSALCGAAQSVGQLIAFRVLQGIGGGMLTPIGVAMLFRTFPPAERARAATIVMIPTMAAPALGPIIGGLITTSIGWRWIFYVNVPIGCAALVFGARFLREHKEATAGPFDATGFALSAVALASAVFALSEGPTTGWTDPLVVVPGVAAVVAGVAAVVVELRVRFPMLALRLLHERLFRTTNLVSLFSMASFIGLVFIVPLYLQTLRGLDPLESGLTTFPQALGVLVTSQVAGRLYAGLGPRRLMAGGLLLATVVNASFALLTLETDLWAVRGLMFARGLCMGFAFVPMQAASYARIDPADNARASAIFATQRQVSVSIGIAVLATVLASYTPLGLPAPDPDRALDGYHATFLVTAVFSFIAALVALTIRDEDAAATMYRRR